MIIRDYVACETCGHSHTVRIGVGSEKHQPYNFPCGECGENISIALEIGKGLILKDNAVKSEEEGAVVNLDSFLLSNPAHTGVDHVEQRVKQARDYLMAQKAHHEKKHGEGSFEQMLLSQPQGQQASVSDEWKILKKCWSLHERQRDKLAQRKIVQANEEIYNYEPLDSFYDWLWRFAVHLSGNVYDEQFEAITDSIVNSCRGNSELTVFTDLLRDGLFKEHLEIYFDIFKQFFEGYSEFNQVYLYCSVGMSIPEGHQATSRHFDDISDFYGNAFEAFTSLVETLACVNNVMTGRAYDQFETMTLEQYKKIDKAGKCNPFALNQPFTKLCENVDNQLRNASHHGGFRFNQETGIIKYRAGKGGTGEEREIAYTDYIVKCTDLFLAIVTLLRIELAMHEHM